MKKLVIMLVVLVFASCKSTSGLNNKDYNFKENVLYYKGEEIGHIEAIKLQQKNGKIRREVVLLMNNETEQYNQAVEIINYMRFHTKNSDIELKVNVEKK
jgi:hypothetical protein